MALSNKTKGKIIEQIILVLKAAAKEHCRAFDDGVFFTLCFMDDKELINLWRRLT